MIIKYLKRNRENLFYFGLLFSFLGIYVEQVQKQLMKKIVSLVIIALITSFFISCGPSEASKRAEEEKIQREADSTKNSIKQDIASEMDSLKKDNKASDSLVKVEKK